MAGKRSDEVLNVNVGGKKFTIRRSVLIAEPQSKLAEWFKPNSTKAIAQDKSGNFFLDRDGRTFQHVLNYLRYKRDKQLASLALPSKPDGLARLMAEAEALKLDELKDLCLSMLTSYQREELGYIQAYTHSTLHEYETWNDERRANVATTKASSKDEDENCRRSSSKATTVRRSNMHRTRSRN